MDSLQSQPQSQVKKSTGLRKWLTEELIDRYALSVLQQNSSDRVVVKGNYIPELNRASHRWLSEPTIGTWWHRSKWRRARLKLAMIGKIETASPWGPVTNLVCLDIDCHQSPYGEPVKHRCPFERAEEALKALGVNRKKVSLHSTPSEGLHVWFRLKRNYPTDELRQKIIERLRSKGVKVALGVLEVYPSQGQGIRLPCTTGSVWIDWDGVLRYTTGRNGNIDHQHQLEAWLDFSERTKVELKFLKSLGVVPNAQQKKCLSINTSQSGSSGEDVSVRLYGRQFEERATRLWEHGPEDAGTRFFVIQNLVHWRVTRGYAKNLSELQAQMRSWWIRTEGGQSVTARKGWNRSIEDLDTQVKAHGTKTLKWLAEGRLKFIKAKQEGSLKPLTDAERRRIKVLVDGHVPDEWKARVWTAIEHIAPRLRNGRLAPVYAYQWREWTEKNVTRKYKKLQVYVRACLKLGRVGRYKVSGDSTKGYAQHWGSELFPDHSVHDVADKYHLIRGEGDWRALQTQEDGIARWYLTGGEKPAGKKHWRLEWLEKPNIREMLLV